MTQPTEEVETLEVREKNNESQNVQKKSKRLLSRPERIAKKIKNSKISKINSDTLVEHYNLYEQNFEEFFQDVEVKKIMIEEKNKEQIKNHIRNKKNIAQSKKDSNEGNFKGKKYRNNLVENNFNSDAENYDPSDEEPIILTETEKELISNDLDVNSSISSETSLSDLSDTFSQKKKFKASCQQSTKKLKEAQVEEIKMYRQNQNEKSETNNFFKLFLIQQLQKLNDDPQKLNNTENNSRDIKVESKITNSKHLIQISTQENIELILQKFSFKVNKVHKKIFTIDGYEISNVCQLKEGEQYIFE